MAGTGGARGGKASAANSGLAALVSGQSLLGTPGLVSAAKAITSSQFGGPISEIARAIALNNQRGRANETLANKYFSNLGQYGQQAANRISSIGSGLNQQLSANASNLDQTLQGIGNQGMQSLARYTPGISGNPGQAQLAQAMAQQRGYGAQSMTGFKDFGATQSANYGSLAAANLQSYMKGGQEALTQIAQGTNAANEPLTSKLASLAEQEGPAYVKNLMGLRQQEIANAFTQQGLNISGIKADQAGQMTAAQAAASRRADAAAARAARRDAAQQKNKTGPYALPKPASTSKTRAASRAAGGGGALTLNENINWLKDLNKVQGVITTWQQGGIKDNKGNVLIRHPTKQQMVPILQGGRYDQNAIDAAFELLTWGYITPGTALAMHQEGVRGGTFRGKPIRVSPPPAPAKPNVGGVGRTGGLGVGT